MVTSNRGTDIRQELAETLARVKTQIDVVNRDAADMGISAHDMKDATGNYVLIPLLAAKAQCLHSLVLVNQS